MEAAPAGLLGALVARVLGGVAPGRLWVQGVGGPQGSGKSTLAAALSRELRGRGLRVAVLSLDDLYLPRAERRRMARQVHPLFATRGPPGTHDVALGLEVIDELGRAGKTLIPRFDKATDDRGHPEPFEGPADAVVFEGWCLGAAPQADPLALARPVNDLEREADAAGRWRAAVEAALARGYPELWTRLDSLAWLRAPAWAAVTAWRAQAERALRARLAADGGPGRAMTDAELARFMQHYERITRRLIAEPPARADLVAGLDEARGVTEVVDRR